MDRDNAANIAESQSISFGHIVHLILREHQFLPCFDELLDEQDIIVASYCAGELIAGV